VAIVVIVVLVVLAIGVYLFTGRRRRAPRQDREEGLRRAADRLGFTYERDCNPFRQDPSLDESLRPLEVPPPRDCARRHRLPRAPDVLGELPRARSGRGRGPRDPRPGADRLLGRPRRRRTLGGGGRGSSVVVYRQPASRTARDREVPPDQIADFFARAEEIAARYSVK